MNRELTIRLGDEELTVTDLGAGLRTYTAGGRAVLDGCVPGEPCTAGRGQLLLPWPNRIADATYVFEGVRYDLPVTEEKSGSAIHGSPAARRGRSCRSARTASRSATTCGRSRATRSRCGWRWTTRSRRRACACG